MGSLNRVHLIGNLGKDAEVRYTAGGAAIANFSLATTETWKDKSGEKQERTDWHRCQLWGKSAESLAEYLTKGKQVAIEGKIHYSQYEKDGVKMYSTEIRVDNVVLLGGGGNGERRSGGGGGGTRAAAGTGDHSEPLMDEEIPFSWIIPMMIPLLAASALWI